MDLNSHTVEVKRGEIDALRKGFETNRSDPAPFKHPVQAAFFQTTKLEKMTEDLLVRTTFGFPLVARLSIEQNILSQNPTRPPFFRSSNVGLDTLTGKDEDFDFSDYFGDESEPLGLRLGSFHEAMESHLGLDLH
eukprot:TRINITY_DN1141_c0_g1_i1.p1 TRINITY_DN1141_c0_g1~~TRINITY_DN1141_c0_g1_i1.p1  ORF type:complete len:153 (+),score=45.86 TRINITY_DN1141_c0_g1_i1:56-460(+)